MALVPCPECNQQVSTAATTCPHCGYPLKPLERKPMYYEYKTVKLALWGLGGSAVIVEKLLPDFQAGWEIVGIVEDQERGGVVRQVYTVILRRPSISATTIEKKPQLPIGYVYFEKYGYGVILRQDDDAYYVNFDGLDETKKLIKNHPAVKKITKEEYEKSK